MGELLEQAFPQSNYEENDSRPMTTSAPSSVYKYDLDFPSSQPLPNLPWSTVHELPYFPSLQYSSTIGSPSHSNDLFVSSELRALRHPHAGLQRNDMRLYAHSSKDTYYRRAKEVGYRARSAYKLAHIDELYNLLDNVEYAVDLCAAPGSWSQYLVQRLYVDRNRPIPPASIDSDSTYISHAQSHQHNSSSATFHPLIVSIDLAEMAPIDGVHIIQGDITSPTIAQKVCARFHNHKSDILVCDGAPDVSGNHDIDEYVHAELLVAALNISTHVLQKGGTFVAKFFYASNYPLLHSQMSCWFTDVRYVKPHSSRVRSAEHFLLCTGYKPPRNYKPFWCSNVSEEQQNELTNQQVSLMRYMKYGDLSGVNNIQTRDSNQPIHNESSNDKKKLHQTLLPCHYI